MVTKKRIISETPLAMIQLKLDSRQIRPTFPSLETELNLISAERENRRGSRETFTGGNRMLRVEIFLNCALFK